MRRGLEIMVSGNGGRAVAAFDLDGTLIDSMPTIIRLLTLALTGSDSDHAMPRSRQFVDARLGPPEERIIEFLADRDKVGWYVAEYVSFLNSLPLSDVRRFANAILDQAEARGFGIIVVTNKSTRLATATLDVLGISDRCEVVVDGYCPEGPKPSPGGLLRAIDDVGGSPGKTVLVGDSDTDGATARSAGVRFARACWFPNVRDAGVAPDCSTSSDGYEYVYRPEELAAVLDYVHDYGLSDC